MIRGIFGFGSGVSVGTRIQFEFRGLVGTGFLFSSIGTVRSEDPGFLPGPCCCLSPLPRGPANWSHGCCLGLAPGSFAWGKRLRPGTVGLGWWEGRGK